ncbi:MAG: ABC-F family ATP-binding cassette domain-containing protein, partial [Firmicutes bacterium]|nr:ABC-F family ATP-binding cassette domain-containing protein [Bacillota bacterium]
MALTGIGKSFGARQIFSSVSLRLQPGSKAGLIGPNGSGKSTLLQIIAGLLEPDSGTVSLARGAKAGYLPQEPGAGARGTLREELERPFGRLLELQKKITSLEQEIARESRPGREPPGRLLSRYGELRRQFESEDGYLIESRIESVARGLGLASGEMNRSVSGFSGGEKARANLAALLLGDPQLLLLDEPTNFLDFEGLAWLEKYLLDSPATLLVVSHDRFFLDRVVSQIFDLRAGNLHSYRGDYSAYRIRHEAQKKSARRAYREQQALIARTEKQIRQSKADRRSKRQARSRQKRLERLRPLGAPAAEKKFKLDLDYAGRSGRQVITFEEVSRSFGEKRLFEELSFQVRWGDRIALVGPNGAGKSTLLRMIAGLEQPSAGRIRLGPAVSVAYFAQEQEQLDPGSTVLEEIAAASDLGLKEARDHLGRYLFGGDDVFKKISSLSGGEKSRLALARLALRPGNCLLVDEPTSHLDLPALEELETVLRRYPGTLVAVSHDRYFLKGLVNRVFELQSGSLAIYEGGFEQYLESREEGGKEKRAAEEGAAGERKRRALQERRRARERQNRERRLREE